MLTFRFHKSEIINHPVRTTGKNNDVERLKVINPKDLEARVIHCGQRGHSVEDVMMHSTVYVICQTALPEFLFGSCRFIPG